MWLVIGVLVLIGIGWVALGNRNGGNSPKDWARDYAEDAADTLHKKVWGDDD